MIEDQGQASIGLELSITADDDTETMTLRYAKGINPRYVTRVLRVLAAGIEAES